MKYKIKLTTYSTEESAEAIISKALEHRNVLSHGTVIDLFSQGIEHKNGIFNGKKRAKIVAENINKRGTFGGFGKFAVIATVVAA